MTLNVIHLQPIVSSDIVGVHLQSWTDVADLLQWADEQDAIYCTAAAKRDGGRVIEIGIVPGGPVAANFGDWIIFDGSSFQALSDEDAQAKYQATG